MLHKVNSRIVCSLEKDPWYNLALEEKLLSDVNENEIILYLWQNENTIVIGRNQNPYRECRHIEFMEQGGKVARRLSGGGAVYHDSGNLNFTFVMDKRLADVPKQLKVIIDALKLAGIDAEFSGRNDILAGGRKISGNAFYETRNACYHHGTILVNSDLGKLSQYLQVSESKISSKGIKSVSSRVTNLRLIKNNLTMEQIIQCLEQSFQENYSQTQEKACFSKAETPLNDLYDKYSSWQWIFGETPEFDVDFQKRFSFGEVNLMLKINDGRISNSKIYSDAMDSIMIQNIANSLVGLPFKKESLKHALDSLDEKYQGNQISTDLIHWICNMI